MKTLAPAVVATAAVTLLASCATDYDNVAYDPGGSTHFFSLSNRNNDRGYGLPLLQLRRPLLRRFPLSAAVSGLA
jgi:hypothetical protein